MVTTKVQFRRLALKSPPLGPKWDRWAKKLVGETVFTIYT